MKKYFRLILMSLTLLSLPTIANAVFSVEDYRTLGQDPEAKVILELSVLGANEGISYANAYLKSQKRKMLFCPPQKFTKDLPIIFSIINQELNHPIRGSAYEDELPIGMVLLYAFMHQFPCE